MIDNTILISAGILLVSIASWLHLSGKLKKIKEAERNIRELQAKLVHAGRLSALGEMTSGIAHEINQPLAIIRLKADGLKAAFHAAGPDSKAARASDVIIDQVDRATAIIRSMRSFSRVAPDGPAESIDPVEVVEEGLSFFREQFRIHQIRLDVSMADGLQKIGISQQKFEQIVVNFLSNARFAVVKRGEASGPDYEKRISVRLFYDEPGSRVVFEVADNGIGMSPEVKARCLEPFFTTKKAGEGTGIGLSITHGIAKEFEFDIEVESKEGEGSVFRILAPAPIKEKTDDG